MPASKMLQQKNIRNFGKTVKIAACNVIKNNMILERNLITRAHIKLSGPRKVKFHLWLEVLEYTESIFL